MQVGQGPARGLLPYRFTASTDVVGGLLGGGHEEERPEPPSSTEPISRRSSGKTSEPCPAQGTSGCYEHFRINFVKLLEQYQWTAESIDGQVLRRVSRSGELDLAAQLEALQMADFEIISDAPSEPFRRKHPPRRRPSSSAQKAKGSHGIAGLAGSKITEMSRLFVRKLRANSPLNQPRPSGGGNQ